jgi:uncharacterized membrane protein YhiD involved in acid resistance
MSLSDWIITLTIIITIVPLVKMAKDKRFGFYNISIVLIGIIVLVLSIRKNRIDDCISSKKERASYVSDSTNKSEIKKLGQESSQSKILLSNIKSSLDSIGIGLNNQGDISIDNPKKLKDRILKINSQTNVTSINQKGGQTAGSITNN